MHVCDSAGLEGAQLVSTGGNEERVAKVAQDGGRAVEGGA
jgi:hypothetical protein